MVEFWSQKAESCLSSETQGFRGFHPCGIEGKDLVFHCLLGFTTCDALCSQPATSTGAAPQAAALQDKAVSADSSG